MKQRTIHIGLWLCVLALCLLSSSTLLAQDDPVEQAPQAAPLLFEGMLNDGDDSEGNHVIFDIALNAGDQITATALCEMAADGHRLIDPALTVSAPQIDDTQERLQWYNDDNDTVTDCVDYRSSQISFEAPVSGDYEFVIENLASRSGPFSLEILGSTALQTELDLAPSAGDEELLVESGAEEPPEIVALAADQEDLAATASSTTTVTFTGTLSETGGPIYYRYYDILANEGDNIVLKLICDEHDGGRPLDPFITTAGGFVEGSDEVGGVACDNDEANAVLEVTAAEDGPVYFTIFNDASVKAPYTLSISGSSATQPEADTPLWDGTGTDVPGPLGYCGFRGRRRHPHREH